MGLVLLYQMGGVLSLTRGAIGVFGAVLFQGWVESGRSMWLALPAGLLLSAAIAGAVGWLMAKWFADKSLLIRSAVTIACAVSFSALALRVYGTDSLVFPASVVVSANTLLAPALAAVTGTGVWGLLRFSRPGVWLRAMAERAPTAELLGGAGAESECRAVGLRRSSGRARRDPGRANAAERCLQPGLRHHSGSGSGAHRRIPQFRHHDRRRNCTQVGRLVAGNKVYALEGQSADSACWNTPYATPLNSGPKLSLAVSSYFLMKNLGGEDVCTMWNSREDSNKALNNFQRILKKLTGRELRKVLSWNGGDLTPILTQVRQNGCKAVLLGGTSATYVSLMQAAANQGLTNGSIVWLGLGTGYTEKVANSVRTSGYWSNSEFLPWSLDTSALEEFRDLQKEHGFSLDSTAESGYTAAKLFVTALKGIKGKIDRKSVGTALRSMKNVSTDGLTAKPFTWGE
ncbi:ABC transporter substrate-binding protein [Streptomyces sp. NBC_00631]